jgi:hypothetical protein
MRKVAAGLLVLGFASTAFGGTVVFSPNPAGPIDNSGGAVPVALQVSIGESIFTTINSFDVLMGSDTLQIDNFVFAAGIPGAFPLNSIANPANPPVYADDISIGGFAFSAVTAAGLPLGTLNITVPAGLAPGDYFIDVNSQRDNNRSVLGGATGGDPLSGRALIHVVPEPATISLLGLAGLALLRRRKTA